MRTFPARWLLPLFLGTAAGCAEQAAPAGGGPPADPDAAVRAALQQLSPEDRALAERQRVCPVMPDVRLGETGTPKKLVLKGEVVFVCCENCVRIAREDPDAALAGLKELKKAQRTAPAESPPAAAGK